MVEPFKIDTDMHSLRNTVSTILHLLYDFIPKACYRDAEDKLAEAFREDGIELTSKMMRKEYEAWKELTLDKDIFK